jgi:hypothetical protein
MLSQNLLKVLPGPEVLTFSANKQFQKWAVLCRRIHRKNQQGERGGIHPYQSFHSINPFVARG